MDRKFSIATFALVAVWFAALDRLAKTWASANLAGGAAVDLGVVKLTLVHNRGAAFGIGQGQTWLFAVIATVIVLAILAWLFFGKVQGMLEVVSLGLVAAGGVGNLVDRLSTGYVVDFIQLTFIDFPVFNVADICVTVGVALLIFALFRKLRADQREIYRELEEQSAAKRAQAAQAAARASAPAAADTEDEWDESDEEWERAERAKLDGDDA